MGRRWAREKTFQLLYQIGMRDDEPLEQIQIFLDNLHDTFEADEENPSNFQVTEEDKEYIRRVCEGVILERDVLDDEIQSRLKSWTLERLPRVDRALLRLGAYEIKHSEDVPKSVSINEVVVLAKQYAAEDAHSYINGVLAHFDKQENDDLIAEEAEVQVEEDD